MLTIVAGIGVIYGVYRATSNAQVTAGISRLKDEVTPTIVAHQEQWRAWKYLGMNDTLDAELSAFGRANSMRALKVIPRSQIDQPVPSNALVFPEKPAATEADGSDLVLYAEVDGERIQDILKLPRTVGIASGAVVLILLTSVLLSGRYVYVSIYRPIQRLSQALDERGKGPNSYLDLKEIPAAGEMKGFVRTVDHLLGRMQAYERQAAVLEVASQVSHDIRSPLAALNVVIPDLEQLEEEKRLIARSAVARIQDIANSLLQKSRELELDDRSPRVEHAASRRDEPVGRVHVFSLAETVVSERRLQLGSAQRIEISLQMSAGSEALFALAQPIELRRLLSNLISNSVEAIEDRGKVELRIHGSEEQVVIQIVDSGKGIAPELLSRLGAKGASFGKPSGNGLGLYHACQSAAKWGGRLQLSSELYKGTTATLELKRSDSPSWFAERVDLTQRNLVIILDDDPSIHQVWEARLREISGPGYPVRILHFREPDELYIWWRNERTLHENPLILSDFDLRAERDGLDLIKDLDLASRAILVTSSHENPRLRVRCERIGVKVLPKQLAAFIPIKYSRVEVQTYEAVQ